ncbi:MAG: ArdC family protein [Candidatus Thorarchaeota archaeon]
MQTEQTQDAVSTVDLEGTPLTLEMRELLTFSVDHVTGRRVADEWDRAIPTAVTYNPESQRFEVPFGRKPAAWVRDVLKSMHFGWNKFEGCWELYTWQVRLYEREPIGAFLSSLFSGVLIDPPEVPDGARRRWWKEVRDMPAKFVEQLAEATDAERNREGVGQWLRFVRGFKQYSPYNILSILIQCPEASFVAGERHWNSLGRFVKWGESPIIILGPRFKTIKEDDPETGEEVKTKVLAGFLALPVYDVSQTEGESLPEPMRIPRIEGDEGMVFLEAMKSPCVEHEIMYNFAELEDGLGGQSARRWIRVDNTGSINEQLALMVHEVAHEYLHWDGLAKPSQRKLETKKWQREVEAEGVAYVVCSFFGLPTTSSPYLAAEGASGKDIMTLVITSLEAASSIICYLIEKACWGKPFALKSFR